MASELTKGLTSGPTPPGYLKTNVTIRKDVHREIKATAKVLGLHLYQVWTQAGLMWLKKPPVEGYPDPEYHDILRAILAGPDKEMADDTRKHLRWLGRHLEKQVAVLK